MICPYCNLHYNDFKTGLTFQAVYDMIYHRKWKRRNGVLGYWHQLKKEMFEQHKNECNEENIDSPNAIFDFY